VWDVGSELNDRRRLSGPIPSDSWRFPASVLAFHSSTNVFDIVLDFLAAYRGIIHSNVSMAILQYEAHSRAFSANGCFMSIVRKTSSAMKL
jgi:hypothetical protein